MSENQDVLKKPRAKRSASKFLVLRDVSKEATLDGSKTVYEVAAEASTIKSARAEIIKQRIIGNLLTVCVRRRGTSTLPQQLELKGL